ncbi:MAG: ferritin family protein [Candidatus Aminicenantes bacterium]|jgi:rubrerythrin
MAENKTLDIIKKAILLEHRGKALYESVAQKTEVAPVKELFHMLVQEEEKHIDILNKQFALVAKGKDFETGELDKVEDITAKTVLSKAIVDGISGAGYEAAVIAAALEFEKNAVEYYGQQESAAGSPQEKRLFNWLVKWETEHMTMLAKIDDDLKEQIWYDNSFWPM